MMLHGVVRCALLSGLIFGHLRPLSAQEEDVAAETLTFVTRTDEDLARQREQQIQDLLERGDQMDDPGYVPGYRRNPGLGLPPDAPFLSPALSGMLAPPMGTRLLLPGGKASFGGYLQPAVRMGIGRGTGATTTLHADPVVPGAAYGWFDHTNTVPTPWAQLNFRYGTDRVSANAVIGAWSVGRADEASGYFMSNAQVLFSDAWLTWTPDLTPVRLRLNAGAFPDRYGFMSRWHQGAYGISLIGDIFGMGVTGTLELPFVGDFDVILEGGFKGELDKVPLGMPPDGSNEHAMAREGSTFATHAHLGIQFADTVTPTAHFIYSWSQDDRKDLPDNPATPQLDSQQRKDGRLLVLGGDLRLDRKRFGYLYLGGSHVIARHTDSMTNLVRILNTGGGSEFSRHFFGLDSNGSGTMTLLGFQYALSLGTLLRYPMPYFGEGPDLSLHFFGLYGWITSDSPSLVDRNMLKYGTEAIYSFSRLVSAAFRLDHVMPDMAVSGKSFAVFTPRLILRSDWNTRESLTIQYSYYALGSRVQVQGDNRLTNTLSNNPDRHVLAIFGTIWW